MRIAIIDLGTNSVRFDVHTLGKKAKLLHREKHMIRLGQGVFVKGRMDASTMDRAIGTFQHFKRVADGLGVRKIVAFGTSALREALDSQAFVERVREASGIEIKVISGKEEAKLIALGILTNEKIPKGRFLLVDIGGGSTEVSLCRGKKSFRADSLPLGTARIQQVFLKKNPPRAAAVRQLREYIRNILRQQVNEGWAQTATILGSSGTVKAVAKILGKKTFTTRELSELVADLSTMNTGEILEVPGMEAKRVDMILGGAILLEEIALHFGVKKILPTDFSLRDGIIEEEKRLAKANKSSLIELHLEDLFGRAERYGLDVEHLRQMVQLAGDLYKGLRPLHRLHPKWEVYLLSAVMLRNAGEVVSFAGRERHSYYIVKNSDFPAMQSWEHEFIARLCLLHSGGKPVGKDLRSIGKEKERLVAFRKLLALVRVVDALDLGARTTLRIRKISLLQREVKIIYSGVGTAGIEQLMVDRKKKLFEETFKRLLVLERWKRA